MGAQNWKALMTTITVANSEELYAALASARGGETILMEGGDYGSLNLTSASGFGMSLASGLTLMSRDAKNPAIFTSADVRDTIGLTLNKLTFDYRFDPIDAINYRPFSFSNAQDLTISNSVFDGDVASSMSPIDNGYGYGVGLSVDFSDRATIDGNQFFNFHRGLVLSEGAAYTVLNNDIHSIRSDGINVYSMDGIIIEGNHIHDFVASLSSNDHRDFIQFWTTNTSAPSQDVVIRKNVLDQGSGDWTQSIFMRNEEVDNGRAGREMYYSNILIEENTIINQHIHGILVGEADGLTIKNNTIVRNLDGDASTYLEKVTIPRITLSEQSYNVKVYNNQTHEVFGAPGTPEFLIVDNAIMEILGEDLLATYEAYFLSSTIGGAPMDGGWLSLSHFDGNGGSMGANARQIDGTELPSEAPFDVKIDPINPAVSNFDASELFAALAPFYADLSFQWDFGNGFSANGVEVAHTFSDPGGYKVRLEVSTGGISLSNGTHDIVLLENEILGLDPSGALYSKRFEEGFTADDIFNEDGHLQMSGAGSLLEVPRNIVNGLFGADQFDVALTVTPEVSSFGGEIFRLHGSMSMRVDDIGRVTFQGYFDDNRELVTLTADADRLVAGKANDIRLIHDTSGTELIINGQTAAAATYLGGLSNLKGHDFHIGNPFGNENFSGTLNDLTITDTRIKYSEKPETLVIQPSPEATEPPASVPDADPIIPPEFLDSLDFKSMPIEDFQPRQQDFGDHGVSEDGATLRLDSQAWQTALMDVEVTADTWLSFDFSANVEGEFHGVMFTNGDALSADTAFNVFGTQNFGIQDYAYTGAGDVQRFDIHVGKHFTGNFDSLVFMTDDDANVGADSLFANVAFSAGTVVSPAPLPAPEPETMGVVQRVEDLTHEARTVEFRDGLMLEDVIVFATSPSFHGTDAASVAFDDVTATGATMKIREPDYLNGLHPAEDVTLLAMEAGSWTLSDGSRLEVGSMAVQEWPTEIFHSVTFAEAFDEAPVVLVQLQTSNGADWAVLRTRDITTTGFEVALQEQESSDGRSDAEIIGWMALDAAAADGVIDWAGLAAQALTVDNLADHEGGSIAFDAALGMDALVSAGISSYNGSDPATLRLGQTQTDEVRTIAEFIVQEEQSLDAEVRHVLEDISALAFAQEGTLSAIATPADLFLTGMMDTDLG
jgi:parallel beta-helix repeat protein